MDLDINTEDLKRQLKELDVTIQEYWERVQEYFQSLSQLGIIAWSLIGAGLLFIIIGFILL